MNHDHIQNETNLLQSFSSILLFVLAIIVYFHAVSKTNRRYKQWPFIRIIFWVLGVLCIAGTVVGPLASRAHVDFVVHMVNHLLLGMLAPLLLVLAAPMTLLLRITKVKIARRIMRIMKSKPIRFFTNPLLAAILNIGGLWLLYTTNLFSEMHQNTMLYFLVHLHVFLAGYLFTLSMISVDPNPHQTSFNYRALVLVCYLAGHGILSKYIYALPPKGIPLEQAEIGGMLMYYGGDAIDVVLIFIFCLQWYRATRPRRREFVLSSC